MKSLQAAAVHLTAFSQQTWNRRNAAGSQTFWWQVQQSDGFHSCRQFSTQSDKQEAAPKPLPGAQDCDDAIEHYSRARSLYQGNLAPPSSYKTATQRVIDIFVGIIRGTISLLGWVVQLPAKLFLLSRWSRNDWSTWWAGAKKVMKDEAHHYWVSKHRVASSSFTSLHPAASGVWLMKHSSVCWLVQSAHVHSPH